MHKIFLIWTLLAAAALAATPAAERGNTTQPGNTAEQGNTAQQDSTGQQQPGAKPGPDPVVLGERGCLGPGRTCTSPIDRPPLFFKAEWKQPIGKEHPAAAGDLIAPNLIARFYG